MQPWNPPTQALSRAFFLRQFYDGHVCLSAVGDGPIHQLGDTPRCADARTSTRYNTEEDVASRVPCPCAAIGIPHSDLNRPQTVCKILPAGIITILGEGFPFYQSWTFRVCDRANHMGFIFPVVVLRRRVMISDHQYTD